MSSSLPGAVIWDVDGTLVDTAELHFRAWVDLCRDLGHDFTRADFAATFGMRNPEILDVLFGRPGHRRSPVTWRRVQQQV